MNMPKLKLQEIEVDSFATMEVDTGRGTVEANEFTLQGETVLCTRCGNQHCGAE